MGRGGESPSYEVDSGEPRDYLVAEGYYHQLRSIFASYQPGTKSPPW